MADLVGMSVKEVDVSLSKIPERKIWRKVSRNNDFEDNQVDYSCMRI